MSWKVYSKNGQTVRCVINELEYSGSFMNERIVISTIVSDSEIGFEIFDYITYRGEHFEIEMLPTIKKVSSREYKYELRLVSLKYELERCIMRDIIPGDNGIVYPTPLVIDFTGTVNYLAERIQACLNDMYGNGIWSITVAEGTESEEKNISISNQNCWNALSLVNTEYNLNYFIKGRAVTIGGSEPVVNNVFQYGKGKGLYEIERVADTNTGVVTKLRAYGGTKNLDYSYPKKPEWGDSALPTNYALSPLRLMLPDFKKDGKTDYVLASDASIAKYGIREGVITYDDIYPSIEGMKNSSGQEIDRIKGVDAITSDTQPTFTVYLYDLGFDLSDNLTTEDAQISMKSGALQGYAFNITKIDKQSDGSYKLELGRNTLEEGDTKNFTVPNKDWTMDKGDKFVLLNILMPQEYVRSAENRLLARAEEYLAEYSKTNYSYNVGVDEIFMAKNRNFYDEIMEGKRLTVNDNEIGIDNEDIIIQSLTIKEGDGMIPTFSVTLDNKPSVSTLDRIQGQINNIESSVNNKFSSASELSKQYRKKLDTAYFERLIGAIDKSGNEIPANTYENNIDSIKSKFGLWTERYMSAMGKNPGTGEGGGGGATTLGGLNNVGAWADEIPSSDRVLVQLSGATHWTSKPLSEIVGLDTDALSSYLTSNSYATQPWVNTQLGSYATAASLKTVSDKLDDFLTGTDTDNVINKWKELEGFLSGFKETDTLAGALALKADKTQLSDYVTVGTAQTISGSKTFTSHLHIGGPTSAAIMAEMPSDASSYMALGYWDDTTGKHIASIGYRNTTQKIILNPVGSAEQWVDSLGKYSLVIGNNTLTYNTYPILHTGNYAEKLDGRYITKAFFSRLFGIHDSSDGEVSVNDMDAVIASIESKFGLWTERYMSAMGKNPGSGSGGGGLIQAVYGYADLGGDFSDSNLTDTFNAYTINKLAQRLSAVEGGGGGSVDMTTVWDALAANTSEQINVSHIPSLDWSKIGSGKPTTLAGYGITDGLTASTGDGRYVKKSGDTMTGSLTTINLYASCFEATLKGVYTSNSLYLPDNAVSYGPTSQPRIGRFDRGAGATVLQLGTANTFEIIDKNWDYDIITVAGGTTNPFKVRGNNSSGQYIQIGDGSATGAEVGWYTGIGAYLQNDRLGSAPTLSLGGVDSLADGLRFRYSNTYYTIHHNGNWIQNVANSFQNQQTLNLSGYDSNTWYPCWISTSAYDGTPTRIVFFNGLRGNKPSWGTHGYGFSLLLDVTCWGNGWGTIPSSMTCYEYTSSYGGETALGGVEQNTMGSTWLFYLRGGAIYYYWTSNGGSIGSSTSGYSWNSGEYSFSRSPKTSQGSPLSGMYVNANLESNVASATKLQTARSLWGNTFDGTSNATGTISVTGSELSLQTVGTMLVNYSTAGGDYNEGIRIGRSTNGWSSIQFGAANAWSGYQAGQWCVGRSPANYFVIGYTPNQSPNGSWKSGNVMISASGFITADGLNAISRIFINSYNNASYAMSTPSFICNSWVRTVGATGWYSETYGGGIYASDSTYVRTYNNKAFHSANSNYYAFNSAGGYYSDAGYQVTTADSYEGVLANNGSVFNVNAKSTPTICYNRIMQWSDVMTNVGYQTRYSISSYRNGYQFGAMVFSIGTNDAGTTGRQLVLWANGNMDWYGTFHATVGMWTEGYSSAKGQNTSSDMRLKNWVRNISIPVEAIAAAPSFEYRWKDGQGGLEAGSSAQYWEGVVKPCVPTGPDGYLSMRYGQIALLCEISLAKKFLEMDRMQVMLQKRTETLEEKMRRIESENRELLEFKRKVEQRLSA